MSTRTHRLILPLAAVLLVLLAIFAFARPVHAEGEEPPPPESTEIVATGDAAPDAAEVTPTPEVVDPPPADETPVDEALPDETILPDVVDALAQTGTVLVDEFGNPIPAGSEAMTEALLDGDPWYKVGGVTYNYTTADCDPYTAGAQPCGNPITAALSQINTRNLTVDGGTLYVELGVFTENVVINGSLAGINRLYTLAGAGSGATTLNGTITIQNMPYGFTLSGFNINAAGGAHAVLVDNNSGTITLTDVTIKNTAGNGLVVQNQNGAVTLTNVKVDGNSGNGASIDNSASTYASITIYDSSFNRNNGAGYGLNITTNGYATLTNVSASYNSNGDGAVINVKQAFYLTNGYFVTNNKWGLRTDASNQGSLSLTNVIANSNSSGGLNLTSRNYVYLQGVQASSNTGASHPGATIDTCILVGGVCTTSGTGSVSIYSSNFDSNGSYGLSITHKGALYMDQVTVNSNTTYGARLDSQYSYAAVTIQRSTFSGNQGGDGLNVKSQGSITLNTVVADSNPGAGSYGAVLDNTFGSGWVFIYDYLGTYTDNYGAMIAPNTFSSNNAGGLKVLSKGSALLTGITASSNWGPGAEIDLLGGTGYASVTHAEFASDRTYGLWVKAKGAIILDSVTGRDNNTFAGYYGAYLVNHTGFGGVSLYSNYYGNSFSNNSGTGLFIQTTGGVSLTGIMARANASNGAVINASGASAYVIIYNGVFDNNSNRGLEITSTGFVSWYSGSASSSSTAQGVVIDNSSASHDYAYVSISSVTASSNATGGFNITSRGAVTLTNINAANNSGNGVTVVNTASTAFQPVTIMSTNYSTMYSMWATFYGNTNIGISVQSKGSISLINANLQNTSGGAGWAASLNNSTGSGYVSLTNVNMDYAANNGLRVISAGSILLYNVSVYNPVGYTAWLTNTASPNDYAYVSVTLGIFPYSSAEGLRIETKGAVYITNINAWGNASQGLYVDNTNGASGMPVSITNYRPGGYGDLTGNGLGGINILSEGSVTVGGVNADGSTGTHSGYINNTGGYGYIYIYDSDFNSNTLGGGLTIRANGAVTLYDVDARNNFGAGLDIVNTTGAYANPVTVNRGVYSGNRGDGMHILSNGAVTIYDVTSSANITSGNWYGLWVDNTGSTIASPVTVLGLSARCNFTNNTAMGMRIHSDGTITLGNLSATFNTGHNAQLDNHTGSGYISITDASFTDSSIGGGMYGLDIDTTGAVYLYSVVANSNDGYGADINNTGSTYGAGVFITYGEYSGNKLTGLSVQSKGSILVSYVDARYNGNPGNGRGMNLDNSTGSGYVSITGKSWDPYWSRVSNNYAENIYITTTGAVYLSYLDAKYTGAPSCGAVSVYAGGYVSIMNLFSSNSQNVGLLVSTPGSIYLYNVTSFLNQSSGVYLTSSGDYAFVSVNYSDATSNGGYGFYISARSTSPVTFYTVRSYNNTGGNGYGVFVDNTAGTGSMGVTVSNAYGESIMSANAKAGLYIRTNGPISLTGVRSQGNPQYGADLQSTGTYGYISIYSSSFSGNGAAAIGLGAVTPSWISAYYVSASNNTLTGMRLQSTGAGQSVSVYGGTFNYNGNSGHGLSITANGPVTISGITANGNTGGGVVVDNTAGTNSVTVNAAFGANTFNSNMLDGIKINSKGAVYVYNVTANRNHGNAGINILNYTGSGTVSIYTASLYQNDREGLHIQSNNTVTLSSLMVMGNGFTGLTYDGVYISTTNHNMVIYYSTFMGNALYGLNAGIGAAQTLTLYGTRYYGNGLATGVGNIWHNGTLIVYP